jgi:hypothetical protein
MADAVSGTQLRVIADAILKQNLPTEIWDIAFDATIWLLLHSKSTQDAPQDVMFHVPYWGFYEKGTVAVQPI